MAVSLAQMMRFVELMQRFQAVVREVRITGRHGKENDAEHSFQLAMTAWYLNEAGGWGLDASRLMIDALVHDMPEAYAGDLHIFHPDHANKHVAEAASLARIEREFPEFPSLAAAVKRYEAQDDAESQCVYALDKLMPMVVIYLEGGSTWRELNFSMDALLANKTERIARDPNVFRLHQELSQLIRDRPELFGVL